MRTTVQKSPSRNLVIDSIAETMDLHGVTLSANELQVKLGMSTGATKSCKTTTDNSKRNRQFKKDHTDIHL
ncbi:hypothetical protein LD39_15820 [Halobacillus sp. BBL2006]|nr:hypothetical protein LD39_15820 [Halobacillus sp. BBL2006]